MKRTELIGARTFLSAVAPERGVAPKTSIAPAGGQLAADKNVRAPVPLGPFGLALRIAIVSAVIFSVPRSASAAARLSLPGARGFPGKTVSAPMSLSGTTNLVALQADVLFGAGNLTSAAASRGAALGNQVLVSSRPGSGVRRVLIYSLNNAVISTGVVANLPFTVSPAARTTIPLTLSNVIMAAGNASSITSSNSSGYISVEPLFVRPDGDVDVFFNSVLGKTYFIQATTNLVQWVNILTNTATSDILTFTDPNAHLFRHRFYRTMLFDPGVRLGDLALQPNGVFSFDLNGTQGRTYIIQASTNLVSWVSISTNYSAGDVIAFTDTEAFKYRNRFYRAVLFDGSSGGRIGTITRMPNGQANFSFGGISGRTYTIQASTNLAQWVNLSTVLATNGSINFVDTSATNFAYRFYRVQLAP